MFAGILGVIVGVVLILPAGYMGTLLGAMFLLMGAGVFVMGLVRRENSINYCLISFFSEGRFCRSDGWGEEEQYRYNNKPGYGDQGKDNPKDQRTYDNYSA